MHYRVGISNARFKNGKPAPRFFGPLVLLDFVAPEKAQQFRKLAKYHHQAWRELSRKYPWAPFDSDQADTHDKARKRESAKLRRRVLKRFAKICEVAL